MEIETTRFGKVNVDTRHVIDFPEGIEESADLRQYVLMRPGEGDAFFWLQSCEKPDLAFLVADPTKLDKDWAVCQGELEAHDRENLHVLVLVKKADDQITCNTQNPLIIDKVTRRGRQIVVKDETASTHQALTHMSRSR